MNQTIKIIDLLSKIANGEEVPKRIKFKNIIYKFNESCHQYYEEGKRSYFSNKLKYDGNIEWEFYEDYLNDEVEIIEDKEDINIQDIKEIDVELFNNQSDLEHKINDLIKAVKHLEKTKEDK